MLLEEKIQTLKDVFQDSIFSDIQYPETPLSSYKYCPFCGRQSLSANCEKSKKCNKCNSVFFTNPAAAVCAVIISKNKILFMVRNIEPSKNKLDLPGGFVDLNETAEQALLRELKEELALKVIKYDYITSVPNIYRYKNITYNTLDLFYLCKTTSLTTIKLDNENKAYKLLSLDELSIVDIGLDSMKIFFKYLKNYK